MRLRSVRTRSAIYRRTMVLHVFLGLLPTQWAINEACMLKCGLDTTVCVKCNPPPPGNVRTKKQVYQFILNHQRLHEFLLQNNDHHWQCNPVAIIPSAGGKFSGYRPLEWHWETSEQHSTALNHSQTGVHVMLSSGGETAKNRRVTGPGCTEGAVLL